MKKVAIIGLFATGKEVSDGQSIKTRIFANEIVNTFGNENVWQIDTYGWKKHPHKLMLKSILAVLKCDDVIFMTDQGGIKVFPWLLRMANIIGKCNIHYVVVGGWLVHFLKKHKFLTYCLKGIKKIYVETHVMKNGLGNMGFRNVCLMLNCKPLQIITEDELLYQKEAPYKLCIFSRIMREKGVEEAVEAVLDVNKSLGKTVFTLDLYGQVDTEQTEWFDKFSETFPPEVKYEGIVPFDKSVDVIKNYYALLFPTKFYTEGIPGTIIDAYASGVPVIASEWESYKDIIVPGVTGISYPFFKTEELKNILKNISMDPDIINGMKVNCILKAKEYLPENVIGVLIREITSENK